MDCTWICDCTCVAFRLHESSDARFFLAGVEWKLWEPQRYVFTDILLMNDTSESHVGCLCCLKGHFKVIDATIPAYESDGTTPNCGYEYPSTGQIIELEARVYLYTDGFEIKIYPTGSGGNEGNIYRGVATTAMACMPTCMMYHEDPETGDGIWYNYPRDSDETNNPTGNAVRVLGPPPNDDASVYAIPMYKTEEPYRPEVMIYLGGDPTLCNEGCTMLSCVLCDNTRPIFPQEDSEGCCPVRLWDGFPMYFDYWAHNCPTAYIGELDDGSPICQRYHMDTLSVDIPKQFEQGHHELCAVNICDLLMNGGGDYQGNPIDNQDIWWKKSDSSDDAWKDTPAEACSDDTCVMYGGQVWEADLGGVNYWACVQDGLEPSDPEFPNIEFCFQIPCVLSGYSEYKIRLWGENASPQLGQQVQLSDLCTQLNTPPTIVADDPDRNAIAFVETVYSALAWTNPNGQWDQRNGVPICEWGQNDLKVEEVAPDICATNLLPYPVGSIDKYECPLCVPSPDTCPNDPAHPEDPDSLAPCVHHKLLIIEGTDCQDAVSNAQLWVQQHVEQPTTSADYSDDCTWVYPKAPVCAITYRNCQINPPDNDHQLPWASLELTICYSCPPGCHWSCKNKDACGWEDETNNFTQEDGFTVNGDCEDLYSLIQAEYNNWMNQMGDRDSPALDTGNGPDVFNYWILNDAGSQDQMDIMDLCECDDYVPPECTWCECVCFQFVGDGMGGGNVMPYDDNDCHCLDNLSNGLSDWCHDCHDDPGNCGAVIAPDNVMVEQCMSQRSCWGDHCRGGYDWQYNPSIACGSTQDSGGVESDYPMLTDDCVQTCGDPEDADRVHVTAWYMSCNYDSGNNTATGSLRVCRWCEAILCDPRDTVMDYPHPCYTVGAQRLIVCDHLPNTEEHKTWSDGVAYLNEVQDWLDEIDPNSNCYYGGRNIYGNTGEVIEVMCYQTTCDKECNGKWPNERTEISVGVGLNPPDPDDACKADPSCIDNNNCDDCDYTNYSPDSTCKNFYYNLLHNRIDAEKNDVLNNHPDAVFCGEELDNPTLDNWHWANWNNQYCYAVHSGAYHGCWYT